jgi:hypothetical protein
LSCASFSRFFCRRHFSAFPVQIFPPIFVRCAFPAEPFWSQFYKIFLQEIMT